MTTQITPHEILSKIPTLVLNTTALQELGFFLVMFLWTFSWMNWDLIVPYIKSKWREWRGNDNQ